jgi:hypothetical protein
MIVHNDHINLYLVFLGRIWPKFKDEKEFCKIDPCLQMEFCNIDPRSQVGKDAGLTVILDSHTNNMKLMSLVLNILLPLILVLFYVCIHMLNYT